MLTDLHQLRDPEGISWQDVSEHRMAYINKQSEEISSWNKLYVKAANRINDLELALTAKADEYKQNKQEYLDHIEGLEGEISTLKSQYAAIYDKDVALCAEIATLKVKLKEAENIVDGLAGTWSDVGMICLREVAASYRAKYPKGGENE
jgi:chromosome segregation ATPase